MGRKKKGKTFSGLFNDLFYSQITGQELHKFCRYNHLAQNSLETARLESVLIHSMASQFLSI